MPWVLQHMLGEGAVLPTISFADRTRVETLLQFSNGDAWQITSESLFLPIRCVHLDTPLMQPNGVCAPRVTCGVWPLATNEALLKMRNRAQHPPQNVMSDQEVADVKASMRALCPGVHLPFAYYECRRIVQ